MNSAIYIFVLLGYKRCQPKLIYFLDSLGIMETGRTLSDDPMTIKRSHSSLSDSIWWWNSSERLSPKKTMSGLRMASSSPALHWGQRGITYNTKIYYLQSKDVLPTIRVTAYSQGFR